MFPFEFRTEVNHEETTVMGLFSSEDPMISHIDTVPECDSQTDGFTVVLCVASYADAL